VIIHLCDVIQGQHLGLIEVNWVFHPPLELENDEKETWEITQENWEMTLVDFDHKSLGQSLLVL
jgi:hypothetical protein